MNKKYPAGAPQIGDVDVFDGTVTDGGVRFVEVSEGSGDSLDSLEVTIRVRYTGWLEDGSVFDSSYIRGNGAPADFPLSNLIPGFSEGVQGMKPGGERRILIPPHLAYGKQGVPGSIPPNATIQFNVELTEIVE